MKNKILLVITLVLVMSFFTTSVAAQDVRGIKMYAEGDFDYIKIDPSEVYSDIIVLNNEYQTEYIYTGNYNLDYLEFDIIVVINGIEDSRKMLVSFGETESLNVSNVFVYITFTNFDIAVFTGDQVPIDLTLILAIGAIGAIVVIAIILAVMKKQ